MYGLCMGSSVWVDWVVWWVSGLVKKSGGNPIIKCHFQQYFNYIMQGIFFKMLVEKAEKEKPQKNLPMQSVLITTNIVTLNPAQVRCTGYNIMW